ncbi:MerR family transcriptional regulator [Alkalibacillus aidingensis]|uniref:MerR family transcriptional regulator n=1 Tax=Alkalibacillus aidingensis TaxID=2747607 RepID=UPI001660A849|nr:MerR family transcriptional regulator [Alkalibacillus aidingensis]
MKVNEVAKLVGVSVRTLHHYDEIGLLSPFKDPDSGYRHYTDEDLSLLQQILFFKELGFSLKKIKEVIHNPEYDQLEALQLHRKLLIEKRHRMDEMIGTLEQTIESFKGGNHMSNEEKFKGFDFSQNPYEEEARERWGNARVEEAKAQVMKMTDNDQELMNAIYRKLASLRHEDPTSDAAQAAIKEWYDFLNNHFATYTPEMFQGLGMMYVQDERFTRNIDQFGEGLAKFMSEAMIEFGAK